MNAKSPSIRSDARKLLDALMRHFQTATRFDEDEALRWLGEWAPVLRFTERLAKGQAWETQWRDRAKPGWLPLPLADRTLFGRAWVQPTAALAAMPSRPIARVIGDSPGAAVSWALGQAWMRSQPVVLVDGGCASREWSICKPYLTQSDGITIVERLTKSDIASHGIETIIATPASVGEQFSDGLPTSVEVIDPSPSGGPIVVAPHLYSRDELRYLAWRTASDLRAAELGVPGGASTIIVATHWLQLQLFLSMLASSRKPDAALPVLETVESSPSPDGGVREFLAALPDVIRERAPDCISACIFTSMSDFEVDTERLVRLVDGLPCAYVGINQSPILIRVLAELSWRTGPLREGGAANLGEQRIVLCGQASRVPLPPLLVQDQLVGPIASYLGRPGWSTGLEVARKALLLRVGRRVA